MEKKDKVQAAEGDLVHTMNVSQSLLNPKFFLFLGLAVFLGIGSGYVLAGKKGSSTSVVTLKEGEEVSKGTIVGSDDTKTFKDNAEGVLEAGGIEGEGQYHLVRPGGEDQYVYLTSSLVDLSQFEKKKVKVWGETQKAQKAGWLMDVGRVEVLQ